MPKPMPTPADWEKEYREGASRKAGKWQANFLATTGISDAAKSDVAQAQYVAKMTNPEVLRTRQAKLRGLTDEDFKKPVRDGGSGMYSSAVAAKAPKAAKGVAPFLEEIGRVLPTLGLRTDDVDANIDNRVKPLARALRAKKRGTV